MTDRKFLVIYKAKRYDQKVLDLTYFGLPRNEKFATIFQYNSLDLDLDALSPSLFQFAYPSKIEFILVPQVLIYCIYDTFIASEIPTTKVSFQLWEQIEVRRG